MADDRERSGVAKVIKEAWAMMGHMPFPLYQMKPWCWLGQQLSPWPMGNDAVTSKRRPTVAARRAGAGGNARRAAQRATEIAQVIAELQAAGAKTLQAIANGLNDRHIPAATGKRRWLYRWLAFCSAFRPNR
jgi:hypothetical protein